MSEDGTSPNSLNVNFPEQPAHEVRSEWSRTTPGDSTTMPVLPPEMDAAKAAKDAAFKAEEAAARKKAEFDSQQSQIRLQEEDKAYAEKDAAKAKVDGAYAPQLAEMTARLKQTRDDLTKYEAPRLFANRKGWEQALLAVGLTMGAFGGVMDARAARKLGKHIDGGDPVRSIIDMDLNRQREAVNHMTAAELRAKTGLGELNAAKTAAMAQVEVRGAEIFKRIESVVQKRLLAKGLTPEQVELDQNIVKIRQAQADHQLETAKLATGSKTHQDPGTTRGGRSVDRTPAAGKTPQGGALVRDKDGNVIGVAPTPQNVSAMADKQTQMDTAANQIDAYAEFLEKHPGGVWSPADVAEAKRLRSAADIAVASTSNMGLGDKSTELEAGTLGPTGQRPIPGLEAKANPGAVRAKAHEIRERAAQLNNRTLTPIPGAPPPAAPVPHAAPPSPVPASPYVTPPMVPGAKPGPVLTVKETRTLADGRRIQLMSDGSKRLAP